MVTESGKPKVIELENVIVSVVGSGIAAVAIFLSYVFLIWGEPPTSEEKKAQEKILTVQHADELAGDIEYIYDERTGLCYACLWNDMGNGGLSLALVPYEKVKDYLVNPPTNPK